MVYFEDPVAEALAPITDASPEELAEYVRAIASTRPNISVEYISNLLSQDGLVNVQGEELTSYISRALDRILGTNTNKVSAASSSSSSVHASTHPATSSSNSRRTTNSTTTSTNTSRTTSYPKKRDREEPQRRQQLYHDRTASGVAGSSGAGTSPRMWQPSSRDNYSSSTRYGMNQNTNTSTSSHVNRQSNTSMNISNGGGNTHTARSRNAPPQNNNARSTATASFNGGAFHPQYHDYSSNTTPAASSSSSYKQHQSHTKISHPHKRKDQYVNIAVPPPPPPLPIEEQRTLKLTHVPKSVTMVQLSHYFEQHNVAIVSMKLLASSSDPQEHQKQLDPLYHTYVVQCGSHDQAKTILQSFPILGYPCVHITLHPTNLEEGRPEVPRPHPSYNTHHQHYMESKIIPTAAVTVTPINFEYEHHHQQQQQQHLLQQERISSIYKTLQLKHQQEILLQKQLEMQQKILQKVSDSTERKSKVLKEILQLQKRLVALRQEILENQNALATATTTTIHPQQEQQHSSPAKRFRLDRRTKILKVTGFPLELTTLEKLTQHFAAYGRVESIVLMEDEEKRIQEEENNTPLPSIALVTFDTRGSAENAKANGSSFVISDSTTPVELAMSWHKKPTATTCTENTEKKDDDAAVESTPKNMMDETVKNEPLVDDAIVDYEEDEDEDWE